MVCSSCSNSLLDGGETAADFGGADCEGCSSSSSCFPPPPPPLLGAMNGTAPDYVSGQCEAGVYTSCVNGVEDCGTEDGAEPDADCGDN